MKKIFVSMFALSLFCSGVAQESPKNIIGIRAGLNLANMTSYGVSATQKASYNVGVSDQILMTKSLPLYLETGLYFSGKGYKIKGYDDSNTTLKYLQVPVMLNYHINIQNSVTIEPAAGFYYALGVHGERKYNNETHNVFKDGSMNRSDFGLCFGIGATIAKHIYVGANYDLGLIYVSKTDKIYGDSNFIGYKDLKTNCLSIRIGYNF